MVAMATMANKDIATASTAMETWDSYHGFYKPMCNSHTLPMAMAIIFQNPQLDFFLLLPQLLFLLPPGCPAY